MRATKFKLPSGQPHPTLQAYHETAFRETAFRNLMSCNCELVDGDESYFKNDNSTLVIALPELSDSSLKENKQIHEWIDRFLDTLLKAVIELKPDEFEIQPLDGMKGYTRIARFWWD